MPRKPARAQNSGSLYTADQKARRDATVWTRVQAILAPLQFAVFLISLGLVLRYLVTGAGYDAATASIIVKTGLLYTIMVTGAIWEKVVFGQYLLAPAFFWEDVISFGVIALHTAYLVALLAELGGPGLLMGIALVAYAAYAVNATQFLLKLRAARRQSMHESQQRTPSRLPQAPPPSGTRSAGGVSPSAPHREHRDPTGPEVTA